MGSCLLLRAFNAVGEERRQVRRVAEPSYGLAMAQPLILTPSP